MEILLSVGINLLTQMTKKFIEPKYGRLGVQVLVGVLSLIVAGIIAYSTVNPSFMELLKKAGLLLVQSVAIYELVIKNLNK